MSRSVLVTGGNRGIGRAIAESFVASGDKVAVTYRSGELPAGVLGVKCDVTDSDAVEAAFTEAEAAHGPVEILVANAGITRDTLLLRMSEEDFTTVLDTNLTGAFNMIRAVAPTLRAQQYGKIVNVSSVHGLRSEFGIANYSASKAGLLGLTRSAAVELGPSNVNVNAVAPGYIRTTRLAAAVPAEVLDRAREHTSLGRLGDPRDVAHVVVFLCSEFARHLSGVVVPVDGGHLL